MFLCYSKRIFGDFEEIYNEAGVADQKWEPHSEVVKYLYCR